MQYIRNFIIIFFIAFSSCTVENPTPKYNLMDTAEDMLDPIAESSLILGNMIERLVIHCTAQDVRWPWTPDRLVEFFLKSKDKGGRGWSKPGYMFFIDREGEIWQLVEGWNWDKVIDYQEITYGAKGFNSSSLHIVWDGGTYKGKNEDNRTNAQKKALRNFVYLFHKHFPEADIVGHTDLPNVDKGCPLFDVREEYKNILEV